MATLDEPVRSLSDPMAALIMSCHGGKEGRWGNIEQTRARYLASATEDEPVRSLSDPMAALIMSCHGGEWGREGEKHLWVAKYTVLSKIKRVLWPSLTGEKKKLGRGWSKAYARLTSGGLPSECPLNVGRANIRLAIIGHDPLSRPSSTPIRPLETSETEKKESISTCTASACALSTRYSLTRIERGNR